MDALEGLSGEDDSDASSGEESDDPPAVPQPASKKPKLTLDDLEATGYTVEGPSLLYMKAPAEADTQEYRWWVLLFSGRV